MNKRQKIMAIILIVLLLIILGGCGISKIFDGDDKHSDNKKENNEEIKENVDKEESTDDEIEDTEEEENEDVMEEEETAPVIQNKPVINNPSPKPIIPNGNKGTISFYQGTATANQRFEVNNMLPGDKDTKVYQIEINHNADLELFFDVSVKKQTKSLDKILNLKITDLETNNIIYNGSINKFNRKTAIYEILKNADERTLVNLEIEVSLPTSAGNEYQGASLTGDFIFSIMDEQALTPQTGYKVNIGLWITLMIISFGLIILLTRSKDGKNEE